MGGGMMMVGAVLVVVVGIIILRELFREVGVSSRFNGHHGLEESDPLGQIKGRMRTMRNNDESNY